MHFLKNGVIFLEISSILKSNIGSKSSKIFSQNVYFGHTDSLCLNCSTWSYVLIPFIEGLCTYMLSVSYIIEVV